MNNIFIKVTGDLYTDEAFLDFVAEKTKESYVVICVGGGTQINKALEERGIGFIPHGPMGRELSSIEEKQLAKNVLEKNQAELQNILIDREINAHVITPVFDIGSVTCHVNGDEMLRVAYIGFEELYVITTEDRVSKKQAQFKELTKVKIVSI